jgi:hypothetical protein
MLRPASRADCRHDHLEQRAPWSTGPIVGRAQELAVDETRSSRLTARDGRVVCVLSFADPEGGREGRRVATLGRLPAVPLRVTGAVSRSHTRRLQWTTRASVAHFDGRFALRLGEARIRRGSPGAIGARPWRDGAPSTSGRLRCVTWQSGGSAPTRGDHLRRRCSARERAQLAVSPSRHRSPDVRVFRGRG